MFHVDHVRSLIEVGARSLFHRGDAETSSRNSSKSCCVAAISLFAASVFVIFSASVLKFVLPAINLRYFTIVCDFKREAKSRFAESDAVTQNRKPVRCFP